MKLLVKLLGAITLVIATNSHAALVSVNTSADMSSGLPQALNLLPIGTTVTSDIIFNIGNGNISTSTIDSVSGTFSWIDSTYGAQAFTAENALISTINSAGWFNLLFTGTGPTIDGITAGSFSIVFDIGTNPFLPPGSTTELFDLVLSSTIDRLRVGALQGALTQFGDLESNVSGTISAVPIPGALVLFASGLLGLYAARANSSKKL